MFARLRPLAPILALAPVLGLAIAPGASRAATWVDSPLLGPKAFLAPPSKVTPLDGLVPAADDPMAAAVRGDPVGFATDVPEPATWAMMVLGFGLVGASIRRPTGWRRPDA